MRFKLTILLIILNSKNLFPCNCPPPFPNLRSENGEIVSYKSYRIKESNISGIVRIIGCEEKVRFIIDTISCKARYYDEIKSKNIDPKYTSFNKYLQEISALNEVRKYQAIIIKNYKSSSIGDTINLFSDYSNCGIWFRQNEFYEIYGSVIRQDKYLNHDTFSTNGLQLNVPRNSCFVSVCSAEYIKFEKIEK